MDMRRALSCAIILTVILFAFIAGCGSDKKKGESKSGGKITGRIITPENAPSPALGIKLPKKVMVRLYELNKTGLEVRPIEGVGPVELLPNNSFTFTGVPQNMVNLIVRVELEDAAPVASALIPVVPDPGSSESEIIVSMESDLEVKVFMEIVKTGFQQKADTDPAHIDTVFLKSVVTPEAVTTEGASATALVPDFAAAAKSAMLEYSRSMTGEEKPPFHPSVKTILDAMRAAEAEYQLAIEDAFYKKSRIDPERLSKLQKALFDAEAEALEGVTLPTREMPEAPLIARARRNIIQRFVMCLRQGEKAENCPAMKSAEEARKTIGTAVESSHKSKEDTFTTWRRWAQLAGTDGRPDPATSTANAGMTLTAFARLINLPEKTDLAFHDTMRRNWVEISATTPASAERSAAIDRMRTRLRNTRNYLLATCLTAPPETIRRLENELLHAGESLDRTMRERKSGNEGVEEEWFRFQLRLDTAFQPVASLIDSRFMAMEQNDRKKIYWAARDMTLLTLLFDLSPEQYAPADADADGASDISEKALGTNPMKEDSRPAPPLASAPSSSLPAPPADTDRDGIADIAELAAGTDLDTPDAARAFDYFLLCPSPEPENCQKPGDGIDNDNDGKADEETLDGLDNDSDYRIDEDSAEAPPETAPPSPPETAPLSETDKGAVSTPATATFASDEEATAEVEISPATGTFATGTAGDAPAEAPAGEERE